MSVKPLRDYVVVMKDESVKRTTSGIYIEHVEEKNVTGTVVAVGSGRITMNGTIVPLEVNVNDKVVFNKNLASEVKDGDNSVFVLREDQLLCVLS